MKNVRQRCIAVQKKCCNLQFFDTKMRSWRKKVGSVAHFCAGILRIRAIFLHSSVSRQPRTAPVAKEGLKGGHRRTCVIVYEKCCARGFLHESLVLNVNGKLVDDHTGAGLCFAPPLLLASSAYVHAAKWTPPVRRALRNGSTDVAIS